MKIDTGINEQNRKAISENLSRLLASTFTLYLKTHGFHWNVTGPMFVTLHTLFEQQYNELFQATDELAERIRELGYSAPSSYSQYTALSVVREQTQVPKAQEMIKQLLADHEAIIRFARESFITADNAADEATADLVTERLEAHEKNAWMLRSLLEE